MEDVYTNGKECVTISHNNKFLYRVVANVQYENIYCTVQTKYFESDIKIDYIDTVFLNKRITINCYLDSAPKKYIDENRFKLYIKPEKKKRIKKQING